MIFVTVGTHEQQFNRLITCVDEMKENGLIKEEVMIQTGFSTYIPKSCQWKKMLSYNEMQDYIQKARLVITHGGPSSFVAPLQIGKIPIVVPRQKEFGEHVNDHQLDFCKAVEKRWGNIIVVEDIIDSGRTLSYLTEYLRIGGAKSVKTCTLLDKPSRREVDFTPDYRGVEIPDEFVVGYGLDYAEQYRALPYIGILKPEIYSK